jgi:hypothetical protein
VYKVFILDALKIVDVVVGPVLQPSLLAQRNKLVVRRQVELRRVEAYDYNLLLWRPELVQQEAKRS